MITQAEMIAEIRQCIANREAWLKSVAPGSDEIEAKRQRSLAVLREIEARLVQADAAPPAGGA